MRKELGDYLSQLGADTILNKDGQTALMQYASALNLASAQMMLRLGSNPNAIDSFGRTTLHYLCQADVDAKILPWLIAKNTHSNRFLCVNAQTLGGVTPLMLACQVGNAKIIVELLKNGASPFLKDQLGWMAENHFTISPQDRDSQQS